MKLIITTCSFFYLFSVFAAEAKAENYRSLSETASKCSENLKIPSISTATGENRLAEDSSMATGWLFSLLKQLDSNEGRPFYSYLFDFLQAKDFHFRVGLSPPAVSS